MKIVAIEGCMGAGKSTMIRGLEPRLRRRPLSQTQQLHIAQEPVEGWAHLLGAFYADPPGHSLALQLAVLFSRIRQLVGILKNSRESVDAAAPAVDNGGEEGALLLVTERSVDSGSDVFVPMLRSAALMTGDEERVYKRRRQTMYASAALMLAATAAFSASSSASYSMMGGEEDDATTEKDEEATCRRRRMSTMMVMQEAAERWREQLTGLHGVVYLEASPETCLRRVRARSRDGETGLTLEYLRDLQAAYAAWLAQLRARGVPVAVVSAEVDGDEEAIADAVDRGVRDCVCASSRT